MAGIQAFGASVELLLEIGPEAVSRRILERAEAVRERALSLGWTVFGSSRPGDLSGIVALERPGADPTRLARELRDRDIVVASRRGKLRISPHVYNDDDDLDLLTHGLALG
jgi:selenocysteine lyase/cysteine desulfurase